jgi:hypothetical protein
MLSAGHKISLALLLAFVCAGAASAQEKSAPKQEEDNYVTSKMFQNRVFEIKNRDPQGLARVLAPLTSGFKGAVVSWNEEFHTISVRDFPENIAVIEEAIRRFDTPEAARPGIEFRVHMLIASNDESEPNQYPAELSDVVKQLQSALSYKNFTLVGSQIVRSKEGQDSNFNMGVADLRLTKNTSAGNYPIHYSYTFNRISLDRSGGPARVQIEDFNIDMSVPIVVGSGQTSFDKVGFKNPVSLREGEYVVAGTTSIADKSVVVVLSVTTIK